MVFRLYDVFLLSTTPPLLSKVEGRFERDRFESSVY